ncbi:MAG: hypothetical protein AB1806_14355 [Acidobacteriota bacterium]
MTGRGVAGTVVVTCAISVWPVLASAGQQPPGSGPGETRVVVVQPRPMDPQMAARFELAKMEGLLEVAVEQGTVMLSRQLRGVMSEMLMTGGTARARGFRLEGYGVFFDVEIPSVSQSIMWSWRVLERDSGGAAMALEALRNHIETVTDPEARRDLDQALRMIELRVSPLSASVLERERAQSATRPGDRVAVQVADLPASKDERQLPENPSAAYTMQVKNSLIDTMLDYSQALSVGPDEFLTVAARDSQARTFPSSGPYDLITIIIRVKGSDLMDFRAGRISREEALKRVEVREY